MKKEGNYKIPEWVHDCYIKNGEPTSIRIEYLKCPKCGNKQNAIIHEFYKNIECKICSQQYHYSEWESGHE